MVDVSSRGRSSLAGVSLPVHPSHAVVLEAAPAARFIYRGARQSLDASYALDLPSIPCRAANAGDHAALWLGPDEWLLIAPVAAPPPRVEGREAYLVDVTHRNAGLIVKGPRAGEGLNASCPLDLDERAFPVGMCTRTLFAKAEIILWRQNPDIFRIEVWRSFVPYVIGLLTVALSDVAARHDMQCAN